MSFSLLYSDIFRTSAWLLEPNIAQAKSAMILSMLNSNTVNLNQKLVVPDLKVFVSTGQKVVEFKASIENSDGRNYFQNYPDGSVAIISFSGVMTKYDTCEAPGTDYISRIIQMAMDSRNIQAIVLMIDSGGGSVGAISPLTEVLGNRTKPVVSLCDCVASAAYWTACDTDHIMMSNTISSQAGSIGVMVSILDFAKMMEMQGIVEHKIYSDLSQHKNEPLELVLKGEYKMIKDEILNPLAKQFQAQVKSKRGSKLDESVEGLLTGKMFFAKDSVKVGLADSIGNLQMAVKKASDLAAAKNFLNNLK